MDKRNAEAWLKQALTDYAAMLPLSARQPVLAVGEQCIAVLASDPGFAGRESDAHGASA